MSADSSEPPIDDSLPESAADEADKRDHGPRFDEEKLAELLHEYHIQQRFGPTDLDERIVALQLWEQRIIDFVAVAEDGRKETLSAGPILALLTHWRLICENHELDEEALECRHQSRETVREAAGLWNDLIETQLAPEDREQLFDGLLHTGHLILEVQRRAPKAVDAVKTLQQSLGKQRDALIQSLTSEPANDELLDRWSRLIADQCDSLMTSIDDLPPDQSTSQIDSTIESVDWHIEHLDTRKKGKSRSRLKRKLRRLLAERQERRLQVAMEKKFSRGFVTFFEQLILVLIVVVLSLMIIEWTFTLSPATRRVFLYIDAAACAIFLTEFFVKLGMVKRKWNWFRRHLLVDLIPSIPVGLLTAGLPTSGDVVRTGRLARFLRLPRLVRYIRILRPIVKILRALGLMARGIDRIVRRYGQAINCNVILCPTRDEVATYIANLPEKTASTQKLWRRIRDEWARMLAEADPFDHSRIAKVRIEILANAIEVKHICFESGTTNTGARDIPAEALLDRMQAIDADSVEVTLGDALVTQIAKVVRTMASFPWRYFPIIRKCIPKQTKEMQDGEAVAAASRLTAGYFRRFHDLWYWLADLYGTVTPSQFVDRVGGTLVKTSFRPAYRLVLFGGVLLSIELLLVVVSLPLLEPLRAFLKNFVGTTVLLLGSVCFFVLALGWWLQRVAQEATEFYERSVQAQFLALTESIRTAKLRDDAAVLFDRVLLPDWPRSDDRSREERLDRFAERLEQSLIRTDMSDPEASRFPFLDRLVMLYRDWLTGPMFTSGDSRATNQLLGNTALRQLLLSSERIDRKQLKKMQLLDLNKQKSLFKGPYLWFNFVSKSIAHSVACLLVDYNRRAIPLHEFDHCTDEQRTAYALWLNPDQTDVGERPAEGRIDESEYVTTAFTALNFLDANPHRDAEIEARFGTGVLERLQRDRCLMMRRIFGTLPMHEQPRDQRVVNLYSFYEGWIAKGRVFLVPWFVFCLLIKFFGRFVAWVYRSVQEIRHPERRTARIDAAQAEFSVAVRKINRIRGPVAEQCILLRAMFDPAYLQVPLPGEDATRLQGADAEFDIPFLNTGPTLAHKLEQERRRAENNMVRLEMLLKGGLLDRIRAKHDLHDGAFQSRQHLRAAAIAIHADIRGIRSHLFADSLLNEVFRTTESEPTFLDRFSCRFRLRRQFNRYWDRYGLTSSMARRRAWRATLLNENGVATALSAWAKHGENVSQQGEQRLGELLLHPGRVSEQLMTLRMVQTLTMLDIQHYREQILSLGQYDVAESTQTLLNLRDHAMQNAT
jgi:hypothetical protein